MNNLSGTLDCFFPEENMLLVFEWDTLYLAGGCLWGVQHLFEIIDPYSVNKQGVDVGEKYRTGIYSTSKKHLDEAKDFIERREDKDKIVVEVLPLSNYVRSAEEHQHHLKRHPEDCSYCHIPDEIMNKYRTK